MAGRSRRHWPRISLRQIAVLVPAAMEELDEAHAALGQAARQNAVGGVGARLARIRAVQFEGGRRAPSRGPSAPAPSSASGTPSRTARCAWRSPGPDTASAFSSFSLRQIVEEAPARVASNSPADSTDTAPGRRPSGTSRPDICVGRKPLPHCRSASACALPRALRHHHDERRQVLFSLPSP